MHPIEKLPNFFDAINFTRKDVETQISAYKLTFDQTRNEKVEWKLKLPAFVRPFYNYIKSRNTIPSQTDYWLFYVSENKDYLTNLNLSQKEKIGVRARVFRAYPSLIRDLHFGLYIRENPFFKSVFYNEMLDIEYGVDLVVENADGVRIGLNFFTKTRTAEYARTVKEYRPKKTVNFPCFEIPIDFSGCKKCGDFFLYSEREMNAVIEIVTRNNRDT